ncbi:BatD family protein [Poseidonibacter ostreae]|jgi:hypothetical protein|uniref:Protein BatD n=1 Tax=Poseidonibacter ostreae TaxID=2654171 RepID=A0A6L4WV85_9BACT|nr:BatD family protein [Poseidonibacter ostreae]KAB7885377.1 hypothetical protein GA417_08565 [Poseidonibacter ostreae]KAB7890361.1 hypothetical protein GBG19_03800 [Poseidonibacter ostreae]KAB7890591.1 hypothetical protein GBG18_08675 [Poseidonibacter ostreae]
MFLIKYFILSSIFLVSLFSNVQLSIPKDVVRGEALFFTIEITGKDVSFPDFKNTSLSSIQEVSSSTSTNIINNQITKKVKKIYSMYPTKDFIFPALKFIVDKKEYFSKQRSISLKNAEKTISSDFDLSLKADVKELYVNENFILTLIFKYKKNANIVDLSFEKPNFENFWYKQLDSSKQYEEGEFVIQELKFLLFPLKSGIIKINPLKINAQIIEANNSFSFFSNATSSVKIYSNDLEFNVKELPSNINLIGKFDIKAKSDKRQINQGEAISFKLEIRGYGNIDDIGDIKLDLKNATVYENKPIVKAEYKENKYQGIYTKVFSIIPNKSMTIPKINLEYFDKELGEVVLKQSDAIDIKLLNTSIVKKPELIQKLNIEIKEKEVVKVIEKVSTKDRIIFFFLGLFVGLLILGLYLYAIKYKNKNKLDETSLLKKIKKSKNKDELLKLLVVYIKIDSSLDELIFKIEKNDDIKLLKKDIIIKIKELKL